MPTVVTVRVDTSDANGGVVRKVREWAERMINEGGLDLDDSGTHHDLMITVELAGQCEPVWGTQLDGDANNDGVSGQDRESYTESR